MNYLCKNYKIITPIYAVIIFNNYDVRWEIFKSNQILYDVKEFIKRKYKISNFSIEINDQV